METTRKNLFNEGVYIFGYLILLIRNVLYATMIVQSSNTVDTILKYIFLGCMGYKLLTQKFSRLRLIVIVALSLLFAYTSITVAYYHLFYSLLLIVALQDVDFRKLIKISAWSKLSILAVHVIVYIGYYIFSPESIVFFYRNGVKRHSFLLGHPNLFTTYLVWASLELIYVYYNKLKKKHYIFIWVINYIFYIFTNSNTGMIVLTGILIFILLEKMAWHHIDNGLLYLSKYIFTIFSIIFPVITVVYTKLHGQLFMLWNWLNDALTGRLMYGAYAYDLYGFTVFGTYINFPSKSYWRGFWFDSIVFDNSYIWLFIINGSIYLIMFSVTFWTISSKTNNIEKIMIIGLAFFGIMEAYMLSANTCFPLLIIGKYIYDQNKISKKYYSEEGMLWKSN